MSLSEANTWQDVLGVQQELVLLTVSICLIVGTGRSTKGFFIYQLHLFCGPPNHSKEYKRKVNVKSAIILYNKNDRKSGQKCFNLVWFGMAGLVWFGSIWFSYRNCNKLSFVSIQCSILPPIIIRWLWKRTRVTIEDVNQNIFSHLRPVCLPSLLSDRCCI